MVKIKSFLKILGPGLLYAGAAVGVSHLVQSTRAGALFNFDLVWVLLLANLLKYPFFEFGPRYAVATGKNLVQGYARVGKWALVMFTFLTVLTMFTVQATVTVVTVGLIAYVFNLTIPVTIIGLIVLVMSMLILMIGRFSLLDKVMKIIMMLLALSTLMAVFAAFGIQKEIAPDMITHFTWTRQADIVFLIAFVGWMPAPIDVSVWSSLWNLAKTEELGYRPELKSILAEFRFGYIGTALLALGFLAMGALVMYGTGEQLSSNGTTFSGQIIQLYTTSLGSWAKWVVSIAAMTTMISTTITVLDAYPRVLAAIYTGFRTSISRPHIKENTYYFTGLIVMVIGAFLMIAFAAKSMVFMVTLATTLSFLTAPLLAWLNYRVVTDSHMPIEARPGYLLKILSWTGIFFFAAFSVVYLYWTFF
ncbi:MAG: divalent metal cation transporter [Bacteroidales bacterium]|jgi:Mn2+/Fe2+ NRAMP family transporter